MGEIVFMIIWAIVILFIGLYAMASLGWCTFLHMLSSIKDED